MNFFKAVCIVKMMYLTYLMAPIDGAVLTGTSDDCPASQGFFKMSGPSNKCYAYYNDARRTFEEAQKWCKSQRGGRFSANLKLAEVDSAIELRSFLVQKYGGIYGAPYPWAWVNARGNGDMYQWQISGVTMPANGALFHSYKKSDKAATDECVMLVTDYVNLGGEPLSPFHHNNCDVPYFTLCEKN